jgi:hypothetical protein
MDKKKSFLAKEKRWNRMNKLQKYNLAVGTIHLVAAIVLIILTKVSTPQTLTIHTTYADDGYTPQMKNLVDVPIGYFSAIFLMLAAVNHIYVATYGQEDYNLGISQGKNTFRWMEYGLSASLMHVMIAMLCGVCDVHLLLGIFGLTMTTMTFGYLQERTHDPELRPFWLGCVPHVFNWAIIASYFFHGVAEYKPPMFVWSIIFFIFSLDATFAVNQYLQQKKLWKWQEYEYGELWFIGLSLVSKQLLAWVNYGGTLRLKDSGLSADRAGRIR